MRVRCAVSPRHPVVFGEVEFGSRAKPFDFSTSGDILTHATSLRVWVSNQSDHLTRALTTISCCPNLRTLDVFQLGYETDEGPDRYMPIPVTRLHLPHLRGLRIDPRLPVLFTALLLSNCSNLEHLIIDSSQRSFTWGYPVSSFRTDYALHQFSNLRTLKITSELSLKWFNKEINTRPLPKPVKIPGFFRLGDPPPELVDAPSLRRLNVVVPPYDHTSCARNHTFHRAYTNIMDFRLHPVLSALPRLHELSLSSATENPQQEVVINIELALQHALRVIQLDHGPDIDPIIKSAHRWPRSLRVLILRSPWCAKTPSEATFRRLKDICHARRVILRRKGWAF